MSDLFNADHPPREESAPFHEAIPSGRALRASDNDREQTAARLRYAAVEGRLLPEEFEGRLHAAFSARTCGELNAIVGDLPNPRPLRSARAATLAPLRLLPLAVDIPLRTSAERPQIDRLL